jgi:hypothetical protein
MLFFEGDSFSNIYFSEFSLSLMVFSETLLLSNSSEFFAKTGTERSLDNLFDWRYSLYYFILYYLLVPRLALIDSISRLNLDE